MNAKELPLTSKPKKYFPKKPTAGLKPLSSIEKAWTNHPGNQAEEERSQAKQKHYWKLITKPSYKTGENRGSLGFFLTLKDVFRRQGRATFWHTVNKDHHTLMIEFRFL